MIVVELVVIAALAFCAIVVIGTLVAAASLLGWLISLPFRLFGLALRGLGLLVGLPFLIVGAVLAVVFFGVGALLALLPLAPLALLVLGIVWLVRHSARRAVAP